QPFSIAFRYGGMRAVLFLRRKRTRLYCPARQRATSRLKSRDIRARRAFSPRRVALTTEVFMTLHMGEVAYDSDQALPFVDSRIYSEQSIFEEELEKI